MKYGKPIWQLVAEAADSLKKETFTAAYVVDKVHETHPEVPEISITSYVIAMAPNHPFSWHWASTRKNHPYFYYLGNRQFKLLKLNEKPSIEKPKTEQQSNVEIRVTKNGPYIVYGNVPLFEMTIKCDSKGIPAQWVKGKKLQSTRIYSLCRCSQSKNKPFCDGTHVKVNFDGTETSDILPFEQMAKKIEGPTLLLKDAEILCASARFCHRGGDIWDQIPKSDDPELRRIALENSCDCPSGRLVIVDKTSSETIEPLLEKGIAFISDPGAGIDGPLWVRGGIPIYSSDRKLYEVRNRVTLCRCGKSTIKPFCDSSHYPEEDRELK